MIGVPRAFWIVLGGIASVIVVLAGMILLGLSPESLKPRLVAEVERATGRILTISGKTGIEFSLVPTISMEDVTLANPPGFSRPEMIKIARIELRLALLPLLQHRIEIEHVSLVHPDILLETNKAGGRNWVFTREPPTAAPAPARTPDASPAGGPAKEGFAISLTDGSLADGRVAWIDGATGRHLEAGLPRLTLTAPLDGPIQVTGIVMIEGRTIGLTGRAGPAASTSSEPVTWPVALSLEAEGASVSARGQIAHPREGRGYSFIVDGNVPDPAAFASLFPGIPLAALKAVTGRAEVTDDGGSVPAISALDIKVGSVGLDAVAHGSRLEGVAVTARGKTPINVAARMVMPGIDSGINGTAGDLAWLSKGASGPISVDLEWNAASARANIKGTIQQPFRLAGFTLDVSGVVPNPALMMERAPPALKSVAFQTRLSDAPGPIPFHFTSNAGDLAGQLSISRQPRLSVTGRVGSERLDLDMLRFPTPANAPTSVQTGTVEPTAKDKTAPLIPDTKLPFDLIRATDADVTLAFGHVLLGGGDMGGITATLSVKDGLLRLEPITIATAGQNSTASFVADASKNPPVVHLAIQAPVLALRPLLAALGLPQAVTGTVGVRADLTGAGETSRTIATSLDGWAGVAIESGQLDARLINAWLAQLRPLHIDGADVTDLRCLAMRADARAGVVTIQPIALNTAALIVDGGGEVDLGHETLALKVRPRTKIGGTGIAVPVRVSGPMGTPSAKVDISPGGGALAGLLLGGKDIMGAAGGGDPCPAALARAREGAGTEGPPGAAK